MVEEVREGMIGGRMSGGTLEKFLNQNTRTRRRLKAITSIEVTGRVCRGGVEGMLGDIERRVG